MGFFWVFYLARVWGALIFGKPQGERKNLAGLLKFGEFSKCKGGGAFYFFPFFWGKTFPQYLKKDRGNFTFLTRLKGGVIFGFRKNFYFLFWVLEFIFFFFPGFFVVFLAPNPWK